MRALGPDPVLIITGDRRDDEGGEEPGAELWRVPFEGWWAPHELTAAAWCRPRRYAVIDGPFVRGTGYTSSAPIPAGEIFRIRVDAPATQ